MMFLAVEPRIVRKDSIVYLRNDLPIGFGNSAPIDMCSKRRLLTRGFVLSDGFERGRLRVRFSCDGREETVEFTASQAEIYLECNPYQMA